MKKVLRSRGISPSAPLDEGRRLHNATSFDDDSSSEVKPDSTADWFDVLEILGDEMLSDMMGCAIPLRNYTAGTAERWEFVSARFDWMAQLVTDLLLGCSPSEIRQWFDSPHPKPGDACPRDMLGGDWTIDCEAALKVRTMANSFVRMRQGGTNV